MLQHLTGGGWGLVIRRILEAATRVLPLIAILFIPIVLGAHHLYPWTHQEHAQKLGDKTNYSKSAVLLRTRDCLFRDLAGARISFESLVARAGSHGG